MLTVQCLQRLNQTFKQNMTCSFTNEPNTFPEVLWYSCLHWASHLAHSLVGALAQTVVTELVSEFVNNHLLHWFECLIGLGELELGIKSLDIAYEVISVSIQFDSG